MNVLHETIAALAEAVDVPVSADVPRERPDAFVTVERSGGGDSETVGTAVLTVQAWSRDRAELEQLVDSVSAALLGMRYTRDRIGRVEVQRSYYPEQVTQTWPRYVLTCTLTCR